MNASYMWEPKLLKKLSIKQQRLKKKFSENNLLIANINPQVGDAATSECIAKEDIVDEGFSSLLKKYKNADAN